MNAKQTSQARQRQPTCQTCRYLERENRQCRLRPPVVIAHADDAPETIWPRVRVDEWCGQHKALESAGGGR